jgi:hypothetical protein
LKTKSDENMEGCGALAPSGAELIEITGNRAKDEVARKLELEQEV